MSISWNDKQVKCWHHAKQVISASYMPMPGDEEEGKSWHKRGERGREGVGRAGGAVNQNKTAKWSKFGPSTSAFHRLFPPLQHSCVCGLRWRGPPQSVFPANHHWSFRDHVHPNIFYSVRKHGHHPMLLGSATMYFTFKGWLRDWMPP